jgi:hypothetical protein
MNKASRGDHEASVRLPFGSGADTEDRNNTDWMAPVMHTSGRVENEYGQVLSRSVEGHPEVWSEFEKKIIV